MKLQVHLLLLGLALPLFAVPGAQAQEAGAYTISYIEAAPTAEGKVIALLKNLEKAGRASAGNLRFDALQRRDRTNQFAIVEAWKDKASHDAYVAAAHTKDFRSNIAPLLIAGYDERPHTGLAAGPVGAAAGARGNAVFAVTHVDVVPPKKDETMVLLQNLAPPSRKDAGSLRYDALQQTSRPNHFTLVEVWSDQKALEAHENSAHVKTFRDVLMPFSGSLFDQRLYRAID